MLFVYQHIIFISTCFLLFSCENEPEPILLPCNEVSNNLKIECFSYPNEYNLNDLFFASRQVGYSVGKAGTILKTVNSGNTWEIIHNSTFPNPITELILTKVYFINNNLGYVGGERKDIGFGDELHKGAILLKTINGGMSWSKIYFKDIKEFDDFIFFDELSGVSIATVDNDSINLTQKIMKTENGGETWSEAILLNIEINSHKFSVSNNVLFILGKDGTQNDIMLFSIDQGKSWSTKLLPRHDCNSVTFISDSIGYLACGPVLVPELIYKTEDRGTTWIHDEISPINSFSIVHLASLKEWLVINSIYKLEKVGTEYLSVLTSFECSETNDAGKIWETKEIEPNCGLEGIYFNLDSTIFYIMGEQCCKFERN